MRVVNVLNDRYGRLVILSQRVDRKQAPCSYVVDQCDCGSVFEYKLNNLRSRNTMSCGCLQKEVVTMHGMNKSKTYVTWRDILQRCNNPNSKSYSNYGGRGITVCKRWHKFPGFYEDMGDKPKILQIDRIDNNKGYYKDNCRWVTPAENIKNRSNSKYWVIFGTKYDSDIEASKALNISKSTVSAWCDGKTVSGNFYPPKLGCYSKLKYEQSGNLSVFP